MSTSYAANNVLAAGYFMQPYSTKLQSSFGKAPYSYSLKSGALPPGVTLTSSGQIIGTLGDTGSWTFTIVAQDSSVPVKTVATSYTIAGSVGVDTYSGLTALPSPNGGTGFFRVEKVGGRWNLVDPLGNLFWMSSVMVASPNFIQSATMKARYNNNTQLFGTHRNERIQSWGFNTIGEYTSTNGLPVQTWTTNPPNPVQLPFIMFLNPVLAEYGSPKQVGLSEPVKNIVAGVPKSTYNSYQGILIDLFDPKFQQGYQYSVNYWQEPFQGGFANIPWVLGIGTDDADRLFGFKNPGNDIYGKHPNAAFLVATTKFSYSGYNDPKLYSKYAWVTYLQNKYGTVAKLNSVWGSNYTAFGDSGGYGKGSGVLDEDGRHTAWLGNDAFLLSNAKPAVAADLNAFLYQLAYQYASVAVNSIRSYDKNHLIIAPMHINTNGYEDRPQVLQAFVDAGFDLLMLGYNEQARSMAGNNATYDLTGLPAYVYYHLSANADSALYAYPSYVPTADFPTQEARAQAYARDLQSFYSATGSNGDHYMLGIDWWELADGTTSEHNNWGLISNKDNAYDGVEDVIAAGKDQWGFATGGEARNYGDFLTGVTQTNNTMLKQLITDELATHPSGKKSAPPPAHSGK